MQRRRFLSAASATAAFSAVPIIRAQAGTKKFRTALIGSGWWGMNILREALTSGQVDPVALADVDPGKLEHASDEVKELTGREPTLPRLPGNCWPRKNLTLPSSRRGITGTRCKPSPP